MIDRAALEDLRAKYGEMLRLRDLDAAGEPHDPRPAMRALAARFPGALREIDELARDAISARLAALERTLEGAPIEPWMIALSRYHARLRVALRVRRAISERTLAAARATGDPELQALDDASLASIIRPPQGRLNRAVLAIVAREVGWAPDAIEALLVSRRARPSR